MKFHLGLDLGSVSLNAALLNEKAEVAYVHPYQRHNGRPIETLKAVLTQILSQFEEKDIYAVAVTGSGRSLISKVLHICAVNDIKASCLGVERVIPEAATVIEIGGECAKLLCFEPNRGRGNKNTLRYFARNTLCAAGTGSFLDQQACRLGYPIEEFSQIALKSKNPSTISGRCSVFAKTDLVHLQQIGTPVYDMIAGLCFAVARNFLSSVGKAKKLHSPVAFIGGVSANVGVVRAFCQFLKLKEKEFVIPEHYYALPAIGAAIEASRLSHSTQVNLSNIMSLGENMPLEQQHRRLEPLQSKLSVFLPGHGQCVRRDSDGHMEVFLGIDVGSISTKLVLIDRQGKLVARHYLLTSGKPIEAVRQGITKIYHELGQSVIVKAAATTGSGRYLTGDFINADVVVNEITAQAKAALNIDPSVDTIFEIGGQDSKFVSLNNGTVVDFAMNKVCAAGCGSFLEEQAQKLKICIEEEFSHLACNSQQPVDCGQRCTVFMESDLNEYLQAGISKEDLTAGLAYSIVKNYLSNVADRQKIGSRIFFQGAVAYNKAVVAAFEKELGIPIIVPANHDVTGAIGAALIALQKVSGQTKFRGFAAIINKRYSLSSFVCNGCGNSCEIKKVEIEGREPLYYGDRCDNRYQKKESGPVVQVPDIFAQREKFLFADYCKEPTEKLMVSTSTNNKKVGIPRVLYFHEFLPQWKAFFSCLGYEVVVSDKTTQRMIDLSSRSSVGETCLPIKVCHGHILNLLEKKIDFLFFPIAVDQEKQHKKEGIKYNCPYVQVAPYMLRAGIDFTTNGLQLLSPLLFYDLSESMVTKQLLKLGKSLSRTASQTKEAIKASYHAQAEFKSALEAEGEKILNSLKPNEHAMVIVGRPYNSCDSGLNLQVASRFRQLGIIPIPMDFLPLSKCEHTLDWGNMYWGYGRKILTAAKIIAEDKRLYAVYITNFRCGPDPFILPFFKKIMGDKPFLQLEFDDHQADTGMLTRLEAFLDSINHNSQQPPQELPPASRWPFVYPPSPVKHGRRKVYIPAMGDYSCAVAAAFRAFGLESEVMYPDEEALRLGRKFTSGKECLPFVITAGSLIKSASSNGFDSSKATFFMPISGGPCRFGLYQANHQLILEKLNLNHVEFVSPNQGNDWFNQLGIPGFAFARHSLKGIAAIEILDRLLRHSRPYEEKQGEVERTYQLCLQDVINDLAQKKDPKMALKRAWKAFSKIKLNQNKTRPFVCVIGEIYLRLSPFANENIVKKLESLGTEVLLSDFSEWLYHVNKSVLLKNRMQNKWGSAFAVWCCDKAMKHDANRLKRAVKENRSLSQEPDVEEMWKNAEHYFLPWFGEASLGLGKAISCMNRGVKGMVNVMPFTCLDGMVCKTQLKRFQDDHPDVAVLNLEFDGQEKASLEDELESFMEQVKSQDTPAHSR